MGSLLFVTCICYTGKTWSKSESKNKGRWTQTQSHRKGHAYLENYISWEDCRCAGLRVPTIRKSLGTPQLHVTRWKSEMNTWKNLPCTNSKNQSIFSILVTPYVTMKKMASALAQQNSTKNKDQPSNFQRVTITPNGPSPIRSSVFIYITSDQSFLEEINSLFRTICCFIIFHISLRKKS